MRLTEQQVQEIIDRGNAARRLLESDDFQSVLNWLDTLHLSALVHCPTGKGHADTRDHHHERLHALRDIEQTVAGWAQALDAYETEGQSGPSDDTDEDDV